MIIHRQLCRAVDICAVPLRAIGACHEHDMSVGTNSQRYGEFQIVRLFAGKRSEAEPHARATLQGDELIFTLNLVFFLSLVLALDCGLFVWMSSFD